MEDNGFYRSFIDLYDIMDDENEIQNDISFLASNKSNKDKLTVDGIKTAAVSLTKSVLKSQRLLKDDPLYYIAVDILTNTYYICYKNLLMIDIDLYKYTCGQDYNNRKDMSDIEKIDDILDRLTFFACRDRLVFEIYRSGGGLHIFISSKPFEHDSDETTQLMLDLQCDYFYIVYSRIRSCSVRLNRKAMEDKVDYTYLQTIHHPLDDPHKIRDPELMSLIKLHLELVNVYSNVDPSTMPR
jgi:hypothetical protein